LRTESFRIGLLHMRADKLIKQTDENLFTSIKNNNQREKQTTQIIDNKSENHSPGIDKNNRFDNLV
jgi:hypothetical protein